MENRYTSYLPDTVLELQEFQRLSEMEGTILEEMAATKEELTKNQWILTAKRSGLLRLAKIMGILGAELLETGALREEILYRWSSRSPYTYFHLQDWLDNCLGTGNYRVEFQKERFFLHLTLELRVQEKKDFLENHLRKIIPANLVLQVDLYTNPYGKLSRMTHGQMKRLRWKYGQIPFKDLTAYAN